jgi:hypothetical protein
MNKKHKLFVEDMRSILNDDTVHTEENERTQRVVIPDEPMDQSDFDLQAELERTFDELFGPIDSD